MEEDGVEGKGNGEGVKQAQKKPSAARGEKVKREEKYCVQSTHLTNQSCPVRAGSYICTHSSVGQSELTVSVSAFVRCFTP